MELKDFVSTVLTEICAGIEDAQNKTDNAIISPCCNCIDGSYRILNNNESSIYCSSVKFDVSVSVTNEKGGKAQISVLAGLINAVVKGGLKEDQASLSRIQFEIPVKWPEKIEFKKKYDAEKINKNIKEFL